MRGDFATASRRLSRFELTTPKKLRWKDNATSTAAPIPAMRRALLSRSEYVGMIRAGVPAYRPVWQEP